MGVTIACSGGTIAAGASATLTVTGTVASDAAPTLVNTSQVQSDTPDPDTTNNAATVTVSTHPQADIGVTKVWGTDTGTFTPLEDTRSNGDVRILLSMTNFGPSRATGAVLTDPLPPHTTFVSSDRPGVCSAPGNVVTCAVGELAVGDAFTVLVRVHIDPAADGTTLENVARARPTSPTPWTPTTARRTALRSEPPPTSRS